MESTLKDIKSKTYGIVSDPTYMSYSLIGFTTLILGYYVFYDKNSSPGSSEEASPKSEDSTSALGGMFGTSESKVEDAPSSEGALGGMFGTSETKEDAPSALGGLFESENKDATSTSREPAPSLFGTSEEPKEEKTVGGKRKKTRRQRKQSRKQNKSKTNKSKK